MEFRNCRLPTIGIRTIVGGDPLAALNQWDFLQMSFSPGLWTIVGGDPLAALNQWNFLQVSFSPRPW